MRLHKASVMVEILDAIKDGSAPMRIIGTDTYAAAMDAYRLFDVVRGDELMARVELVSTEGVSITIGEMQELIKGARSAGNHEYANGLWACIRPFITKAKPPVKPFQREIHIHTWFKHEDGSRVETLTPADIWTMAADMERAKRLAREKLRRNDSVTDVHIVVIHAEDEISEYRVGWDKGAILETVYTHGSPDEEFGFIETA